MKIRIFHLVFILFFALGAVSYAALKDALRAAEDEYTPNDKLTRGVLNIFTSIFEIPVTIYDISVNENPLTGVLYGPPLGVGRWFIRLMTGAAEVLTFEFPPYEPSFEPEYLFFKKGMAE